MYVTAFERKESWILGKVSLLDYIESLTEDNFSYEIQRGIVINRYLDTILDAISQCQPLPPISLVTKSKEPLTQQNFLTEFNILDGLQRTFRLWIYYKLAEIANEKATSDYKVVTKILKEKCFSYTIAVSPRQVRKLFDKQNNINVWNLKEKYQKYDLYIYLWSGLTTEQEIRLMLILNAGQKRMLITHQYELMYMRLFNDYKSEDNKIHIVRAREGRIQDRKVGEYYVSTIIIGIQSLIYAKPIRLSSNLLYKESEEEDKENFDVDSEEQFFSVEFLKDYLDLLYELDRKVSKDRYSTDWFSKDTSISGIMAGIGMCRWWGYTNKDSVLKNLKDSINKIQGEDVYKLHEYQSAYDNLMSRKINIGTVVRRAIAIYTKSLIEGENLTWQAAFSSVSHVNSI